MQPFNVSDFSWHRRFQRFHTFFVTASIADILLFGLMAGLTPGYLSFFALSSCSIVAVLLAYRVLGSWGIKQAMRTGYGNALPDSLGAWLLLSLILGFLLAFNFALGINFYTLFMGAAILLTLLRAVADAVRAQPGVAMGAWTGLCSSTFFALALTAFWLLSGLYIHVFYDLNYVHRPDYQLAVLGIIPAVGLFMGVLVGLWGNRMSRSAPQSKQSVPRTAADWFALADRLEDQDKWREAAQAYQCGLNLDPDPVERWCDFADALAEIHAVAAAEKAYQHTLSSAPQHERARYNLADLQVESARPLEALCQFYRLAETSADEEVRSSARTQIEYIETDLVRRCVRCGASSPLHDFYKNSRTCARLCPSCLDKENEGYSQQFRRYMALFLVAFALVTGLLFWQKLPAYVILLNLLTVFPVLLALLILHELGHAAMTWLLGGQVHVIGVGKGRIIWQVRLGSIRLALHSNPTVGYCSSTFSSQRALRWRSLGLSAGGILVNAGLMALLLPAFDLDRLWNAWAWQEIVVLLNFWFIVISLLPMQVYWGNQFSSVKSDGLLIREILSPAWQPDQTFFAFLNARAFYLVRDGHAAKAISLLQQASGKASAHPLLCNTLSYALLENGQVAEATTLLESVVPPAERIDLTDCRSGWQDFIPLVTDRHKIDAFNLSNLAYALLLLDSGDSQLARAQRCLDEALSLLRWQPAFQSNQATIWLLQGLQDKAIPLYQALLQRGDMDLRSQAITSIWLARAYAQQGDAERSTRLRSAAAQELGSDYFLFTMLDLK